MNREIEFRGKRVDNGEWVYGYLCTSIEYLGDKNPKISIQEDGYFRRVIPETVGQYTGLKDKNKKKIFEGHTVTATWYDYDEPNHSITGVVKYNENWAAYWISDYENNVFCEMNGDGYYTWDIVVVEERR